MNKAKARDDGTTVTSIGVVRGSRLFVQLSAIGEVNDKDKAVFSVGYKGKLVAEHDRPLATVGILVLNEIVQMARYSSSEALEADLAALVVYVGNLGERTKVVRIDSDEQNGDQPPRRDDEPEGPR